MPMNDQQKEQLLQLIRQGEMRKVIDELLALELKNDIRAETNALAARYQHLLQQQRQGVITHEQASTTHNSITNALIVLVEMAHEGKPLPSASSGKKYSRLTTVGLALGILASIVTILTFVFDIFGGSAETLPGDTLELTVFVHGAQGKQDYVLENQGRITLDLGSNRREAEIGERGQAHFTEIPSKFFGKELELSVKAEGYTLAHPEQRFVFDGNPVYLEIQSSCRSCRLRGTVQAQDSFISGAIVMVKGTGLADTTDVGGNFDIRVPPEEERKEYILTVVHDGRIVYEGFATPSPTTPIEILILE